MGIWDWIPAGVWDHSGQDVEGLPDISEPHHQEEKRMYFQLAVLMSSPCDFVT